MSKQEITVMGAAGAVKIKFSRDHLSPVEQGKIFVALTEKGISITEIGKSINMTPSHVSQCVNYYRTLSPHPVVMQLISKGVLGVATAYNIFIKHRSTKAIQIILAAEKIATGLRTKKIMPKHLKIAEVNLKLGVTKAEPLMPILDSFVMDFD